MTVTRISLHKTVATVDRARRMGVTAVPPAQRSLCTIAVGMCRRLCCKSVSQAAITHNISFIVCGLQATLVQEVLSMLSWFADIFQTCIFTRYSVSSKVLPSKIMNLEPKEYHIWRGVTNSEQEATMIAS